MRWVVRIGVVLICLFLWKGIFSAAPDVENGAKEILQHEPFPFPCMLPDTQLYVWALTSDGESTAVGTTMLVVQNVGCSELQDIELVFLADNKQLQFTLDVLLPGCRVYVGESAETAFENWERISYVSHTIKSD